MSRQSKESRMPVIGVIGGGQLARMMIGPAVELGIDLRVFAETVESSARDRATAVGDFRDVDAVLAFARGVDIITFDHEHVPSDVLEALLAAGVAVRPGPSALAAAQDKLHMREVLADLGLPLPVWARADSADDVTRFLAENGGRVVAKTPRGGYDGKGVVVITDASQITEWLAAGPVLLEELVDYARELAQLVARRPSGDIATWPVVQTIQSGGVCAEVILPAPKASQRLMDAAADIGRTIADGLGVTGVLAVELFETTDERILVNELAMRPHNSGHVTIEGSVTGQFEQHLRAIADMPLGSTESRQPWAAMVNVFGAMDTDRYGHLNDQSGVKIHNYGKEPRAGRKVGHVTTVGTELDDVVYRARAAATIFAPAN
jgi:5-(carboxyamino)imidazole ribonucleotide synthase